MRGLAGKPHSLSFYVEFALANYREPARQKLLAEAVGEYIASKEHEFEQDRRGRPAFPKVAFANNRPVGSPQFTDQAKRRHG